MNRRDLVKGGIVALLAGTLAYNKFSSKTGNDNSSCDVILFGMCGKWY